MGYTTLSAQLPAYPEMERIPLHSFSQVLQPRADPRRAQGKRYSLALVLCLIILAKLAGQTTLSGATDWIRHRGVALASCFGLTRSTMPCQMTYCTVLALVDGKHLDALLSAFFARWEAQSRCGDEPSRLQTPEGKADFWDHHTYSPSLDTRICQSSHLCTEEGTKRCSTCLTSSISWLSSELDFVQFRWGNKA